MVFDNDEEVESSNTYAKTIYFCVYSLFEASISRVIHFYPSHDFTRWLLLCTLFAYENPPRFYFSNIFHHNIIVKRRKFFDACLYRIRKGFVFIYQHTYFLSVFVFFHKTDFQRVEMITRNVGCVTSSPGMIFKIRVGTANARRNAGETFRIR